MMHQLPTIQLLLSSKPVQLKNTSNFWRMWKKSSLGSICMIHLASMPSCIDFFKEMLWLTLIKNALLHIQEDTQNFWYVCQWTDYAHPTCLHSGRTMLVYALLHLETAECFCKKVCHQILWTEWVPLKIPSFWSQSAATTFDKLLDIAEFAVPQNWQHTMQMHGFVLILHNKNTFSKFCECCKFLKGPMENDQFSLEESKAGKGQTQSHAWSFSQERQQSQMCS